jgi:hypothetical protein
MTPGEPQSEAPASPATEPVARSHAAHRWYSKTLAVLFAAFCLEMGFFLLLFPWTSWASDFAAFKPAWAPHWEHAWVRIAISALGAVNLYVASVEIYRLRRFAKR